MRVLTAILVYFFCLSAGFAQDCPVVPQGAKPGWSVGFYPRGSKIKGLIPDPPGLTSEIRGFPLKYEQIPGMRNSSTVPVLAFTGKFRACETGRYEFTLVVEGGLSGSRYKHILCIGELEQGPENVFKIGNPKSWEMIGPNLQRPFSGAVDMEKGWHPFRMILLCGAQEFGDKVPLLTERPDKFHLTTILALRVRGPSDDAPRDFKPEEVIQYIPGR